MKDIMTKTKTNKKAVRLTLFCVCGFILAAQTLTSAENLKPYNVLVSDSPSGNLYVIANSNGTLSLRDLVNNFEINSTSTKENLPPNALVFFNNTTILFGMPSGKLYVWNFENENKAVILLDTPKSQNIGRINGQFSVVKNDTNFPSSLYFPSSTGVWQCKINAFNNEKQLSEIRFIPFTTSKGVEQVKALADGTVYYTVKGILKRKKHTADIEKTVAEIKNITAFDVSIDQKYLLLCEKESKLLRLNLAATHLENVENDLLAKAFSSQNNIKGINFVSNVHCFIGTIDGIVQLWNVRTQKRVATFTLNENLLAFHFNYEYSQLLIAGTNTERMQIEIHPYLLLLDELFVTETFEMSEKEKIEGSKQVSYHTLFSKIPSLPITLFSLNDMAILNKETLKIKDLNQRIVAKSRKSTAIKMAENSNIVYTFSLPLYQQTVYDLTFYLGYNELTNYIFRKEMQNIVSINDDYFSRTLSFSVEQPQNGDLFILSVGPKMKSLHYTNNDAKSIDSLFLAQNNVTFQVGTQTYRKNVIRHPLSPLTGALTKDDINAALRNWNEEKPQKEDTFVLFFSTHGTPNPYRYDLDLMVADDTAYAFTHLMDKIIANIPCQNIFIILDACFSGESIKAAQAYFNGLKNNYRTIVILASSNENQVSYELNGHGAFTNLILEGVKNGKADYDHNAQITFEEITQFANTAWNSTQQQANTASILPLSQEATYSVFPKNAPAPVLFYLPKN